MTTINTEVCIIGGGPSGLFAGFECGMHKLDFLIVDNLAEVGGQCMALYPEKPIYDIPAHPSILAKDMIANLKAQVAPFNPQFLLGQKVVSFQVVDEDYFELVTSKGMDIKAKAVIIAAGVGAFGPNRPPIEGLESFEESGAVQYFVRDKESFKGKKVVIAGGGDSAVDWAISLAESDICDGAISIVHRRNKFRASPGSVDKLDALERAGKIKKVVPYQLDSLIGTDGVLKQVKIKTLKGEEKILEADILLPFYGLSQNLGEILNWGLGLDNRLIQVEHASQQTSITGVFAVGDVCSYDGKIKLILTGFSESAKAVRNALKRIRKDEVLHFEHSSNLGIPVGNSSQ